MTYVLENEASFKSEVLEHKGFVLVDFFADWCGPCKALAPILDELSKDFQHKVKIIKVDVDKNCQISSDYQIRSIPTLILFENGKEVERYNQNKTKPSLTGWLNEKILNSKCVI